jgi:membrane protein YqaA with SNARE-associated domain
MLPAPDAVHLALGGLFASSFISATLLPGGSEVVLWSVVREWPDHALAALVAATFGNTLGGMTSYAVGRFVPRRELPRSLAWLHRWGVFALLGSWLPVVGDALCVGAGWLRLNPWSSLFLMAAGKLARYLVVVSLA